MSYQPDETQPNSSRAVRMLGLFYGSSAFIIALLIWPYLVIFMGNLRFVEKPWVNPSVDVGMTVGGLAAAAINIGLLALFGLQHSLMARAGFKKFVLKFIPKDLERSTYVHFANAAIILLLVFWQPIPFVLWDFGKTFAADIMWVMFGLGWLILLFGASSIDLYELWGLRQSWSWFTGKPYRVLPLQTRWLYQQVRNPHYLGILLGIWSARYMTAGHVLFAAGFTIYILIGLKYEERGLVDRYGSDYEDYRRRVPALLPRFWRR